MALGADCSAVSSDLRQLLLVRSTHSAFAALRDDGRIVTWGSPHAGGDSHWAENKGFESIRARDAMQTSYFSMNDMVFAFKPGVKERQGIYSMAWPAQLPL